MNKPGFFPQIGILISLIFLFLVATGPVAATYDSLVDIPTDIVAADRADLDDGTSADADICEMLEEDLGITEPAETGIVSLKISDPVLPGHIPEPVIRCTLMEPGADDVTTFRGGILNHGDSL
jgi:hypothetical protein